MTMCIGLNLGDICTRIGHVVVGMVDHCLIVAAA
jgi:hypothetical protein